MKELADYSTTAADERAKAAPFLKVLAGDKSKIFKEEFGGTGDELVGRISKNGYGLKPPASSFN